jgi:hypothetical protein
VGDTEKSLMKIPVKLHAHARTRAHTHTHTHNPAHMPPATNNNWMWFWNQRSQRGVRTLRNVWLTAPTPSPGMQAGVASLVGTSKALVK